MARPLRRCASTHSKVDSLTLDKSETVNFAEMLKRFPSCVDAVHLNCLNRKWPLTRLTCRVCVWPYTRNDLCGTQTPVKEPTAYERLRAERIARQQLETPLVRGVRLLPTFTPGRCANCLGSLFSGRISCEVCRDTSNEACSWDSSDMTQCATGAHSRACSTTLSLYKLQSVLLGQCAGSVGHGGHGGVPQAQPRHPAT